ncbi:hypothetical protein [Streptomyces spongiae]|nr:hypothetical protein [Streptomyces spongiae]
MLAMSGTINAAHLAENIPVGGLRLAEQELALLDTSGEAHA